MRSAALRLFIASSAILGLVMPAAAQDSDQATGASGGQDADALQCELHIWPIENYYTDVSGLLSAIPIIGFSLDQGARKSQAKTIQGLMGEYLSPEKQVELLKKEDVTKVLGLDGYKIIVEDAFPSDEALRKSKELKAERKNRIAKFKSKERQIDSKSACYAELATTFMVFQKTAVYDSNFTIGWSYREFGNSPTVLKEFSANTGEITSGRLEYFPPQSETDIDAARTELEDQYAKGLLEFAVKLRL